MKGNLEIIIEKDKVLKEYNVNKNKNEFYFLKCLHDTLSENFKIELIRKNCKKYIMMNKGHMISRDDIMKNKINYVKHIILENIEFILKQLSFLNRMNVYYSDLLQFCYTDKMYLIDMDTSCYLTNELDKLHFDNYALFNNFLNYFDLSCDYIFKGKNLFELLSKDYNCSLDKNDEILYNKYYYDIKIDHLYYSSNDRYIQLNIDNIQVPAYEIDNKIKGNYFMTKFPLSGKMKNEWELIKLY